MNTSQPLTVDEASRLAVTAASDDMEYWARSVAVHGQVDLRELVSFLDALRSASTPQHAATAPFPTLVAS